VSTTPGNPGNLKFVWSSWKFLCEISNVDDRCHWFPDSSHDNTGYQIAYLRNWSPYFIFAIAPCCACHVFVLCLGKLVDLLHCVAGRSNANMFWILLEIPPGISWKFVQLNL